ncbi:MAG: hypothetical protein H6707_10995 [Deltaproteobacteria bacterium]|nr:hypothetical protein [Deltaproteobacteria bacterium]
MFVRCNARAGRRGQKRYFPEGIIERKPITAHLRVVQGVVPRDIITAIMKLLALFGCLTVSALAACSWPRDNPLDPANVRVRDGGQADSAARDAGQTADGRALDGSSVDAAIDAAPVFDKGVAPHDTTALDGPDASALTDATSFDARVDAAAADQSTDAAKDLGVDTAQLDASHVDLAAVADAGVADLALADASVDQFVADSSLDSSVSPGPDGPCLGIVCKTFPVSTAPTGQAAAAVAALGANMLIVWSDDRNGQPDIYAAIFDVAGNRIGNEFPVATSVYGEGSPHVASVGSNAIVVWHQSGSNQNYDVYAAIFDATGAKVGGKNIQITFDSTAQLNPTVSSLGGGAIIFWEDRRWSAGLGSEIGGVRLSLTGQLQLPIYRYTNEPWKYKSAPVSVAVGGGAVVAWTDSRMGKDDIYSARVDATGASVGSDYQVTSSTYDEWRPRLAVAGNRLFLSWTLNGKYGESIYATTLGLDGQRNGLPEIRVTQGGRQLNSSVAAYAGDAIILWDTLVNGTGDIYGYRMDSTGSFIGPPFAISKGSQTEGGPSITNINGWLYAVWRDDRNTQSDFDIYGAIVKP